MAKSWQDLGNNRWKLTITSDDPTDDVPPSVFRGTKEEIADLLAESQGHANRRIAELRRTAQPPPAARRELTPAERMQTVADLDNPATVDKAIRRVVESEMGETMEQQRERQKRQEQDDFNRRSIDAASSFADETPEWFPSEHNKKTLANYMLRMGMDYTNRENYTTAFEQLTAAQLLQTRPPEAPPQFEPEENDDERNAPAPQVPRTPTRISTGFTQRDISGTPPRPTTRLKYSREQLAEMGREQYRRLMLTDGKELQRCEDYYSRHPAAKAG